MNIKWKISVALLTLALMLVLFFIFNRQNSQKISSVTEQKQQTEMMTEIKSKNLYWREVLSSAPWEARDSAASVVFQNKIWIMGGLNGNKNTDANHLVKYWEAPYFNDIWSTNDGKNWQLVKSASEWPPRRSMSVIKFNNKLLMFGGWSPINGYTSDVWQSNDGVVWKKIVINAPWRPREGQTAEVFQNKIWLIGGVNYDAQEVKNDVWYSEDGVNWREATGSAPWPPRWDHATAVFNGKVFLAGGMNLTKETFNDVWSSSDGINWELMNGNAPWEKRQGHALLSFKNQLWILGRLNDAESGGTNDMWRSDNGKNWNKIDGNSPWTGREDFSALVFKDSIYIFAGMDADWRWRNDVWVFTDEFIVSADSLISVFIDNSGAERVLLEKNKDKQLPIASITKLMTALVAVEQFGSNDTITITEESVKNKGASGIYKAGESFLFRDALRALLIGSHNEIAQSLTDKIGVSGFVRLMNNRATQMGLSKTNFVNAAGLDPNQENESTNLSTTSDIVRLLKYISEKQPEVLSITAKQKYNLFDASGNFVKTIANTNELVSEQNLPFTILGGKTGETPRAKKNLAIIAQAPNGGKIISAVLGSEDNFGDMKKLLWYINSFSW